MSSQLKRFSIGMVISLGGCFSLSFDVISSSSTFSSSSCVCVYLDRGGEEEEEDGTGSKPVGVAASGHNVSFY